MWYLISFIILLEIPRLQTSDCNFCDVVGALLQQGTSNSQPLHIWWFFSLSSGVSCPSRQLNWAMLFLSQFQPYFCPWIHLVRILMQLPGKLDLFILCFFRPEAITSHLRFPSCVSHHPTVPSPQQLCTMLSSSALEEISLKSCSWFKVRRNIILPIPMDMRQSSPKKMPLRSLQLQAFYTLKTG